ncbi:MAG: CBS domain-containing protein [Patescibacteria group bacterium]|nr:CBS domain-containing protein [Patescibacteria group bacterium]MDW8279845.1 CBS domain-containing protein [bacterium]
MKIKDIMKTNIITVFPDTPYLKVVKILYDNNISGMPVVDENQNLIGMISEKDLFKALYPNYIEFIRNPEKYINLEEQEKNILEIKNNPISLYMSKNIITVSPQTSILAAGGIMLNKHIHRLPVVENNKLVGIVTRKDIYKSILKHYLKF